MEGEPLRFDRQEEWRINQGAWTTCEREPRFGLGLATARAQRALQEMPFDAFEVHWRVMESLLAAGTVDARDLAAMVAQLMTVRYEQGEEGQRRRQTNDYVPPGYAPRPVRVEDVVIDGSPGTESDDAQWRDMLPS